MRDTPRHGDGRSNNRYSLHLATRQCKVCHERKSLDGSRHGYKPLPWFICNDCLAKKVEAPMTLKVVK